MRHYIIITVLLLVTTIANVNGQKYGKDSIECLQNLSTMQEFVKIKVYDYAIKSWLYVFDNCPQASKNIYLHGIKIYKHLLKKSDKERKPDLVDTLMLIYDRRIENFGQKGYVRGRQANDLLKYDKGRIEEAYAYLEESISLQKNKTEAAVALTFIMTSINLSKMDKLTCDQVVKNYSTVNSIVTYNLDKNPNDSKFNGVKDNIESLFSNSECSSCENLIALFEPQYEENIDNIDFHKNTTRILSKKDCEDSEFFEKSAEQLYSLEPSSEAAYSLAKLFNNKGDDKKYTDYMLEAINRENDNIQKATYYYQLSAFEMTENKNNQKARTYALKAIENNPNWGDPYLLIGNLYASSSKKCGENDFQQSAVFWVAVDKFIRAKNVDPNVVDKANESIQKFSVYFPTKEDIFFHGFQEGDNYSVNCWINEKTTVRARK